MVDWCLMPTLEKKKRKTDQKKPISFPLLSNHCYHILEAYKFVFKTTI